MKRILAVILAIAMVLSFTACGSDNSTVPGDVTSSDEASSAPAQNIVTSKPDIFGESDTITIEEAYLTYTLTYENSAVNVEITQYKGSASKLDIPETISGFVVTSIDEYAFSGCKSLISVNIPDSITTIDKGAFQDCTSLTTITIPNGVTTINPYTFAFCSSLTSITIPNSVTTIGFAAFTECASLTSLTIPASVIGINYSFYGCVMLKTVYFSSESQKEQFKDCFESNVELIVK